MVSIRRATIADLMQIQHCNLMNLPENYTFKYYFYHYLSWPYIIYLAELNNKLVGYVLSKIEEDSGTFTHGHITSISILRSYRKLGIAYKLMTAAHQDMRDILGAKYVSLHVRKGNRAALGLYQGRLNYETIDLEEGYYADGEDAYNMRKILDESIRGELNNINKKSKHEEVMDMGQEGKEEKQSEVKEEGEQNEVKQENKKSEDISEEQQNESKNKKRRNKKKK